MLRKKALIVVNFNILKAANGDNALSFYKMLEVLGYQCKVICFDPNAEINENLLCQGITIESYGIKVVHPFYCARKRKRREILENSLDGLNDWLSACAVVFYMGNHNCVIFNRLSQYKKKYNFLLVTQVVEWYTLSRVLKNIEGVRSAIESLKGYIIHVYARNLILWKKLNVIAVSRKLYEQFSKKKCNCLYLPNLYTLQEFKKKQVVRPVQIGYFGDPGKHNSKDLLINLCQGFALRKSDFVNKLEFQVYGVSEADLISKYDFSNELVAEIKGIVFFHGKINKSDVPERIYGVDYTALLRKNCKTLNMGLSSKMVESMSSARPMIANLTSNMQDYMTDGVNCIVVENESPGAFADALARVLALDESEIQTMQENAYQTASENFDWHSKVQYFADYIKSLK